MTEGGKCYAVSSGAYSDYGVWCIFEAKDNAELYAAKHMAISLKEYRRRAALGWRERGALRDHEPRVEEFQFWRSGEVPTNAERSRNEDQ